MLRLKKLVAIMVMALVMSLGTPQAFAGFMPTGITGPSETPGITGPTETPGAAGDISCPGVNGEMGAPGFMDGWMGTGLAAIASLFG